MWIAQDTTESRVPWLNVCAKIWLVCTFSLGTLDSVVSWAIHTLVWVVFADFACHSYQHNILEMFLYLIYIDHRTSCPGAFFLNSEHAIVTKSWFIQEFWKLLEKAGFPPQDYAGHSFRIGAATTAAAVGVEDSMIKTLGRWQSAAFLQYIQSPKTQLAAVSRTLAIQP